YRLTVRDYHDMAGCTDEDDVQLSVTSVAGPFILTSQNSGATWQETSTQTITWNVANTTASPVSCANIEIRLSYDGGFTYPTVLAASEPNDGSATVNIPIGTTNTARVMVKAVGNVFFDINNANIIIEPGVPNFTLALNPASVTECNDGAVSTTVQVGSFMGFNNPVTLSMLNTPPGAIVTFVPSVVVPGNTSTLTISNLGSLFGTYTPTVRGTSTTGNKDVGFPVTLLMTPTTAPNLISPANNSIADVAPLLDWSSVAGFSNYEYQVSGNANFTSIILSGTAATDQVQLGNGLAEGVQYWWRVRVVNNICLGPWSTSYSFTTVMCVSFASTNVPITIPSQGSPTVTSILSIPTSLTLTDVNVSNLVGTHSWVADLEIKLISPAGTQVLIWDKPCGNHDNFNIKFDDEAPAGPWPCPPTDGLTYRPSNAMTPFDGQLSNGTWTLSIHDVANQDGGSLTAWSLKVCGTSACSLTVTQTSGTGNGSLPAAINCAATGDTIYLSASLAGQIINIGSSELIITKNLVIIAQGGNIKITSSGQKVFDIAPGTTFELNGVGVTAGTGLLGSAINSKGNLVLKNASIFKNGSVSGAVLIQNLSGEMKLIGNCFIYN
ncbi:MAG: proprotein convertase P-domain-containing protein, partial [Bacteroidota bacterium]|nr:proprotein convertase P-domain-containing protein [Bacteroidota bacterium]